MAERYAVASGEWNNTATWNGGTLPDPGDDVYANGYTVYITGYSVTANKISNAAGATAADGGSFYATEGAHITVTDGVYAGVAQGWLCLELEGAIFDGNAYGGDASWNPAVGIKGHTVARGVFTGGSAEYASGAYMYPGCLVNGTLIAGSGAPGGNGAGSVFGNAIASSGSPGMNVLYDTIVFIGSATASTNHSGVLVNSQPAIIGLTEANDSTEKSVTVTGSGGSAQYSLLSGDVSGSSIAVESGSTKQELAVDLNAVTIHRDNWSM